MPYIDAGKRKVLDPIIKKLREVLNYDGDLNYVLFALCTRDVIPSYNNYKNFLGEIHEAEEEIRRRLLAPYEDEAMKRNGDV